MINNNILDLKIHIYIRILYLIDENNRNSHSTKIILKNPDFLLGYNYFNFHLTYYKRQNHPIITTKNNWHIFSLLKRLIPKVVSSTVIYNIDWHYKWSHQILPKTFYSFWYMQVYFSLYLSLLLCLTRFVRLP